MRRRDFIRTSLIAGAAVTFAKYTKAYGEFSKTHPAENFDLVVIKGGEPDVMFDRAIKDLGGMSAFVQKGQTVVVKPNIGWDVSPERAGNTNPLLVGRIVEHCLNAGAKKVYVFDNTCDNWAKCYKTSGIEQAVKDAGGQLVPGNTENYYQEVTISNGNLLKTTKVHELILDSDVFINVPVLKHHASADMTMSMKNLMGVVWDRRFWHRNGLHQCIADYASYEKKPALNILDAYRVMYRNGPRGVTTADTELMKTMVLSRDMVAIDTAGVKLLGKNPDEVKYLNFAAEMKIGTKDLDSLKISRIKI
jgi:uncharacterized protein (DUF362 family)